MTPPSTSGLYQQTLCDDERRRLARRRPSQREAAWRKFAEKPYLQAIYDEPEFIVAQYLAARRGGWHTDNVSVASQTRVGGGADAREIADLAGGGVGNVIARNSET